MVIGPLANEASEPGIPGCQVLEIIAYLLFAERRRKVIFSLEHEVSGHIRIEVVQRGDPDPFEHHANIFPGMREIAEFAHIMFILPPARMQLHS